MSMVYSDVIGNGWHKILPIKAKYTKKDVDKILNYSLLNMERTFSIKEAKFVVQCTAIYYNGIEKAECSKYVTRHDPVEGMVS